MSLDRETLAKLKKPLAEGIPFAKRTGVEVLELDVGFVKMSMPFEPNINHVGIMYAGALYTLAELPGGAIFASAFDSRRFYPIVKDMHIRFRRPARTDITVEVRLSAAEIDEIQERAERDGKADYSWDCELHDATGEVVATSTNVYQLRKIGT